MRALRRLLRQTPFYFAWKRLGHWPDFWYWQLRGRPQRSPHLIKQRTVKEYASRFGLRTLVETGTYYGEMIAAVGGLFDSIYSIEFDPDLAEQARRRFQAQPYIHVLQGDSKVLVPQVLSEIHQSALFWLDAGYCGWDDTQGESDRLTTELRAILGHSIREHVILMDDASGLKGHDGSPTLEQLKSALLAEHPGLSIEVKYDILRIHRTGP